MLLLASCSGGPLKEATQPPRPSDTSYDAELARSLGADAYGMKNYITCFLKPGKQQVLALEVVETLENEHHRYMRHQADAGNLVMMGLFLDDNELYEQLVFDVKTRDEAEAIMSRDPKVRKQLVVPEYRVWYGPAALRELRTLNDRVTQTKVAPMSME